MAHVVGVRPGAVLEHDLARLGDARQVLQVPQLVDASVPVEWGEGSVTSDTVQVGLDWEMTVSVNVCRVAAAFTPLQ